MTEPSEPFGPMFTYGVHDTYPDGAEVYAVTVRHVAAKLPRTGDEDEDEVPTGWPDGPIARQVGLVWETRPLGWCASPPTGTWREAVDRAERSFPDRDSAAMFLYGFDAAVRWQRYRQAVATAPWNRGPGRQA